MAQEGQPFQDQKTDPFIDIPRRRLLQIAGAGVAGTGVAGGGAAREGHDAPAEVDILLFTYTSGYRHQSISKANQVITQVLKGRIKEETGADTVNIDVIDGVGVSQEFPTSAEGLAKYNTLVFVNSTGSSLQDPRQRQAFQEYIRNGGGFVGVHATADAGYHWPWYGELVGAYFDNHPSVQEATLAVEDQHHPSTEHLDPKWVHTDEWYDYEPNPRGDVHVLLSINEDTYNNAGMENGRVDHPMAWCQEFQGGRSWYTNLGHRSAT
jgi:type 1 glutamine amidotransferase